MKGLRSKVFGMESPSIIPRFVLISVLSIFIVHTGYAATNSYHIGNSLAWSMQPDGVEAMATEAGLIHEIGYHIRWGLPLNYIWNNPAEVSLSNEFGNYINALSAYEWDVVTFQPFYRGGSTLGQDEAAIVNFINLALAGPSVSPRFYIFSAWPETQDNYQAYWDQAVLNTPNTWTIHTRMYFDHLYGNLVSSIGGIVEIYIIPVGEVLYNLDQAFRNGAYPGINNIADVYFDQVHLLADIGGFIVATTVHATVMRDNPDGLERPLGFFEIKGNSDVTEELKSLIQSVVWDVVTRLPNSGVDIIPAPFVFNSRSNAQPGENIVSNQITIEAINAESEISIVNGTYSINNGPFTGEDGTVRLGDIASVQIQADSQYLTAREAVVTIGGVDGIFSVTTTQGVAAEPTDPLGLIEQVATDLKGLLPTEDKKDARRIKKVLKHLHKVLRKRYWSDTARFNSRSVIKGLSKAVMKLRKIRSLDVSVHIEALVAAADDITSAAI